MHNLNYQLKLLCRHNADGSYATQVNRLRMLQLAARQLKELGYRKMSAQRLKPSWTKGGRTRDIPILTERQRDVLQQAHQLAGKGALIPYHRKYIEQLRIYERQTARAGLSKLHGLRHQYAQTRYQTLTGWPAPAASGPTSKRLTPEQKQIDHEARLTIS